MRQSTLLPFQHHLQARGLQPSTQEVYVACIARLLAWAPYPADALGNAEAYAYRRCGPPLVCKTDKASCLVPALDPEQGLGVRPSASRQGAEIDAVVARLYIIGMGHAETLSATITGRQIRAVIRSPRCDR